MARHGEITSPALHILGIDPELKFSGGETQVLALTRELNRLGHHAELMVDPSGELRTRAVEAGIPCHPLRIRNSIDIRAAMRLRSFLGRDSYDVIHFHTARAHSMAPLARANPAAALVVTRRMDYVPNRYFAPFLYNRAVDGVAAISSAVADVLAKAGVDRARISIVHSGVDTEHFRPPTPDEREAARGSFGLKQGEIAIGALGALEPRKGHQALVRAMTNVLYQGKLLGVKCIIAGDGPERRNLEQLVAELRLRDSVTLAGPMKNPRRLLWAIDMFAMPSIQEGLGIALLEAMACGLPAVASATGGITEVLQGQSAGFLVASGDSAELAAKIIELLPGRTREQMGIAARFRIIDKFSVSAMVAGTLALYTRCVEERAKRCAA